MDTSMLVGAAVGLGLAVLLWRKMQTRRDSKSPLPSAAKQTPAAQTAPPTEAEKAAAAEKRRRYAVLTQAQLEQMPEDKLLEAVICNLHAKMNEDMSDAFPVAATLSKERQAVFLVYTVTYAVNQAGFSRLLDGGKNELLTLCAAALVELNLRKAAGIMLEATKSRRPDALRTVYLDAFNRAKGTEKVVRYIREHASAFCDDAPALEAPDA